MLDVLEEVCDSCSAEMWFSCGLGIARKRGKFYGWVFFFLSLSLFFFNLGGGETE